MNVSALLTYLNYAEGIPQFSILNSQFSISLSPPSKNVELELDKYLVVYYYECIILNMYPPKYFRQPYYSTCSRTSQRIKSPNHRVCVLAQVRR